MVRCTVAIPTYNREDMIRSTLESVLNEHMSELEILIVDDQSKDRVVEVASTYDDPRLRIIVNERNMGLFGNFNRCVELSSAPLLRILCNDDRLTKERLGKEVEFMEANPNVSLLFSKGLRVTKAGKPMGTVGDHFPPGIYDGRDAISAILEFFAHTGINPVTLPSGVTMRKSACLAAGRFDESMFMDGDIDYFLRILRHGDLAVMDDIGCEILIHEQQVSSSLEGNAAILEENFRLAERHSEQLKAQGLFERIIDQFSALAWLFAVRLSLHGRWSEARAHRDLTAHYRVSRIRLFIAVLRTLSRRVVLKYGGVRRIRIAPRAQA